MLMILLHLTLSNALSLSFFTPVTPCTARVLPLFSIFLTFYHFFFHTFLHHPTSYNTYQLT